MTYRGPIVDFRPNMALELAIVLGKVIAIAMGFLTACAVFSPDRWHEVTW